MSRLVRESIEFKRGVDSKKAMGVGKHYIKNLVDDREIYDYVSTCASDLAQEIPKEDIEVFPPNHDPFLNLHIKGLKSDGKNINVSFLPFKDRHWNDGQMEDWGWAIWDEGSGEILLEAEDDFDTVISKIEELLNK